MVCAYQLLWVLYYIPVPISQSRYTRALLTINLQNLFEIIQSGIDVNALDEETGDAPIHSIAKRKRKDRLELLMALLVNSTVDVNLLNSRGNSALHLAVEVQICTVICLCF